MSAVVGQTKQSLQSILKHRPHTALERLGLVWLNNWENNKKDEEFRRVFFLVKKWAGGVNTFYDEQDEKGHAVNNHTHWSSDLNYYSTSEAEHEKQGYPSYDHVSGQGQGKCNGALPCSGSSGLLDNKQIYGQASFAQTAPRQSIIQNLFSG